MSDPEFDIETTTIAETESMGIWKAEEPDGETVYNVQLNNVTIHFFQEEYAEFVQLIKQIK